MEHDSAKGIIAFVCDRRGEIRRVVADQLGVGERLRAGRPLTAVVAEGSLLKALELLRALQEGASAFGHLVEIPVDDELRRIALGGGALGEELLFVGSPSAADAEEAWERLRLDAAVAIASSRGVAEERGDDEAVQGTRERDRLVTLLAHDLRPPLATLARHARSAAPVGGGAGSSQAAARALGMAAELVALVDAALEKAGLPSVAPELARRPTDLVALTWDVVEFSRPLGEPRDVEIAFVPREEKVVAPVDAPRLAHAMGTLLQNALDHAPPGERVDVALEADEDRIVLTVRDEGAGLTPTQLRALGEDDGGRGLGWGLTLARRVVEAHGGSLGIDEDVERGATFVVTLPRASD